MMQYPIVFIPVSSTVSYGNPGKQKIYISGDPFSKSDQNYWLFCVYDLGTGKKKVFARIIFLRCFFNL